MRHVLLDQPIYRISASGDSGRFVDMQMLPTVPFITRLANGTYDIGFAPIKLYGTNGSGNATVAKAQNAGLYDAEVVVDLGGVQKISHRIEVSYFQHFVCLSTDYSR